MSAIATHTASHTNRRCSRRLAASSSARIECRKGTLGLGPNLTATILDISETGVRLILKTELPAGQDVEVLLHGGGYGKPCKRLAKVKWSLRLANGTFCTGIQFERAVRYAEIQRLAKSLR
jgi:hypothetical protein